MSQTVATLTACLANANGAPGKVTKCEKDFTDSGGTEGPAQGGKVFTDSAGGKVFVTLGGKVFSPPG